jgi:hypothetical protein
VKLAVFGADAFESGGSDEGPAGAAFVAVEVICLVWALALLVLGVRAVHGWTWARAAAAVGLAAAAAAAIVLAIEIAAGRDFGLY